MTEVPGDTPVTTPLEEPIVATPVELLVHTPPVVASLSVVVFPAHTDAVPAIAAVGRTVTVAVPLKSAAKDEHLESLNDAIVYVVVEVGDTVTLIGLVAPLNV